MDFCVEPVEGLNGALAAPPSKSYTVRAVLSSLLADGGSIIRCPLYSRDTQAAFNVCEMFGGGLKRGEGLVEVNGTGGKVGVPGSVVDTMNSGTTIRIATGIASLCDTKVTLTGDESIRSRPIKPLLDALSQLGVGASSTKGYPPHSVKGPLAGGLCAIPGDVSSQFVTAILMAAPYARGDVTVELTTELKSRPYVDLTLKMLGLFGIKAENEGYKRFIVPANQVYQATEYTVEGDYSSAAFILAASALTNSEVTVSNLFSDSLQADKEILRILSDMGAEVKASGDSVTVSSDGKLYGVTVDLADCPDLVPVTAALGAFAEGKTRIVNAGHARLKECDRIHAMAEELKKMGANVVERPDGLELTGGLLEGAAVSGWRDHRIIMALTVAAFKAKGTSTISGAEDVDVTFPDFKGCLNALGATIK